MEYLIHLGILFAIYSILGLSLNLVVGFTGLLSISHAAFYGIGAYTTAIILTKTGLGFFTSLILGIIIVLIISFLIGLVLSKFKGDYYALGSIGFNVIVLSVLLNWQDLTAGPLGIAGVSRPEILGIDFSNKFYFLILILIFLLIFYLISLFITKSPFGKILKAIREDDGAIQIFGYNILYFKLVIFIVSAVMAAIAGSFFASFVTFIEPSSFAVSESIFILVVSILGGLASLRGSILGALFLVLLPEILRLIGFPVDIAGQMRQVIYGIILILLMLYRPQGLIGEYKI